MYYTIPSWVRYPFSISGTFSLTLGTNQSQRLAELAPEPGGLAYSRFYDVIAATTADRWNVVESI